MKYIWQVLFVFLVAVLSAHATSPVPFSGKVAINGINFNGDAQFAFSLHDGNGTSHWLHSKQSGDTIKVAVNNGRYNVLLGGQGMNSLPPEIFLKHDKLYLKVEFDNVDGKGLRHLSPDQLITATPRALVAEWSKVAEVAKVAEKLLGDITSDMLSPEILSKLDVNQSTFSIGQITLSMLAPEVRSDLNRTITKSMLGSDVLADLNKTLTITREMLPQDVRNDLNKSVTVTRSMLPTDILSDLNATIGMNRLSTEVTGKLERNATLADGSITGNKLANKTITTAQLNEQILKYLKPEITTPPQAQRVYANSNVSFSVTAEGKYLTYQWKKDGSNLMGETNATLTFTDANATLHDGNYSVEVSNDFGSVESSLTKVLVKDGILNGLVGWWKFDETNGTVAFDSSGNGNNGNLSGGPVWSVGKIDGALTFDGQDDYVLVSKDFGSTVSISAWAKRVSGNNLMLWCFGNQSSGPDLFFSHNKICLNAWDSDANLFGNFLVEANKWYNFSTIISSTETKLYVDGTLLGTANYRSIAEKNFYISMKEQGQGDYAWNGSIDDVRIYDRSLSVAEVQALYNLGQ